MRFSIIIPAYNSVKYISRCIESLINQTFVEWEALIGDDGSNDETFSIIEYYGKNDARIKGFHLQHSGQGSVRNVLLEEATGEFILFLDADDWFDVECLEECNKAINLTVSDIVIFDIRTHEADGRTNCPRRFFITETSTDAKTSAFLISRNPSVVNKAYRKELFLQHGIRFLTHPYEDEIVGLLLNAYANKVCQIPYAFYHYDRTNCISTTHKNDNIYWFLKEFEEITEDFISRGIFNKYKVALGKLMVMLMKCEYDRRRSDPARLLSIKKAFYAQLSEHYSETLSIIQKKILVFGSYNLRSAVNCLFMESENIAHFQFSSLIGAMSTAKRSSIFLSDNKFRAGMVNAELSGSFVNMLSDTEKYDYICIDLLEERFDIIKTSNGYITYSDAFEEALDKNSFDIVKILQRESPEIDELWKQCCDELISIIKTNSLTERVILVKTYLMTHYGEYGGTDSFEDQEKIHRTNQLLEKYYSYLEKSIPQFKTIDMSEKYENFCDKEFRHGCRPWHANEAWFYEVADRIYDYMRN